MITGISSDRDEEPAADNIYLSGRYSEKNPRFHEQDSPWKAQQVLKMMQRHQLHVRSIAEIGCGAGEVLRQLQINLPDGMEFVGYDISPQAYALCEPKANEHLHFYCEDLLTAGSDRFDLVLCLDVIEHVEDYLGFLRALRTKAAYQIFHIPLGLSALTVLRNRSFRAEREQHGHIHFFNRELALAALRDTGCEVVDWFYTPAGFVGVSGLRGRVLTAARRALSLLSLEWSVRTLGGHSLLVLTRSS